MKAKIWVIMHSKSARVYVAILPILILLALLGTGQALWNISAKINGEIYNTPRGEVTDTTPGNFGLPYEDITFTTENDMELSGWFIDNTGTTRAIVLTPGRGTNKWDILEQGPVGYLYRHGYDILLFDPRATGQSDGTKYGFGYYESQDLTNAAEYLVNERGATAIGVWGGSAGASAAIMAALDSDDDLIDAVIADSPYANLRLATSSYQNHEKDLSLQLFFPLYMGIARFTLDFNLGEKTNLSARVKDLKTPLFLIHGLDDQALEPINSQLLYENAGGPKRLWLAEGAWHVGTFEVYPDEYRRKVTAFFDSYMTESDHASGETEG